MFRTKTIAALLIAATAAGCGGTKVVTPPQTVTVQSVEAQTVTEQAPATTTQPLATPAATTTEETVTEEPVEESVKMPNLKGETLDVAEDELDSMGVTYHEVGGGAFGILVKSNWTVCQTRPKTGKKITLATDVSLVVKRECG